MKIIILLFERFSEKIFRLIFLKNVSINEIVPKNNVYNSIFDFC
jgi:hypothetical protein